MSRERFTVAFEKLIGVEGGYVNDPDDPGKETMYGVSRRSHPQWEGWEEIDAYKRMERPIEEWDHVLLLEMAKSLYYKVYWLGVHGDAVTKLNAKFAYESFEAAVNLGVMPTVGLIQTAANSFVADEHDIKVDGLYGPVTQSLVRKLLEDGQRGKAFRKLVEILQAHHYFSLVKQQPVLRKYLVGWLNNRVDF